MIPLLAFDERDDVVLAVLPLVAEGRPLDQVEAHKVVELSGVHAAKVTRVLEIVARAGLYKDGRLVESAMLYLAKRIKTKLDSGPSKRRR
jgi:hypothetical protein